MKMRFFFKEIILLLFLLSSNNMLVSCSNKSKQEANIPDAEVVTNATADRSIKNISALYFNYVFNSNTPLKPEKMQKNIPDFKKDRKGVLDATISDTDKLNKIKSLLESLKVSSQQTPVDARIMFTINYNDKSKDILCIGGQYTNHIYLNGIEQEANNKLLFIIKNYIGFYPWMIGDDMFRMEEMGDNSFPKEPFFSSAYYKQYQEALANR